MPTKIPSVTVVTMLYNRIEELGMQLEHWCKQTFDGSWKIVYWNNNYSRAHEVDSIVAPFRDRLDIKVIHSGHNYHCVARGAVAAVADSELVFMVDDDIIPGQSYLSTFLDAFGQFAAAHAGAPFALCACGHVFKPEVSVLSASEVWEQRRGIKFFDQSSSVTDVDFAHGNNFLISRALFLEATSFSCPEPEFALVDDYWFSYILSHHLNARLIKICTDSFAFSHTAFDSGRAMFYRNDVHAARLKFFAYHIEHGWPPAQIA